MRILFVPSAVGRSHLTRLLLVAEALRSRGAEIAFAYGGPFGDLLDSRGIEHLPLADVADADPRGDVFAAYDADVLEQSVTDGLNAVAATEAQAVVFDLHPAGAVIAYAAGVNCASVTNADLTEGFDLAGVLVNEQRRPARRRRLERVARPLLAVRARFRAGAMRRIARAHGLRNRSSLFDFQRGDITLLADLEAWAPTMRLASGTRYVGPLVWDDGGSLPQWKEGAPTIYVTLSNTGDQRMLDVALAAFPKGSGFRLLVSTGPAIEPPPSTENLHARRLLPGAAAAAASSLVIHCGTSGTTYQTLAAGRPMIVVPYSAGQRITAHLVARHHVGAAFEPSRLDPTRLRNAAERIIATSEHRIAAARFAHLLAKTDGPATAAGAVAELLA